MKCAEIKCWIDGSLLCIGWAWARLWIYSECMWGWGQIHAHTYWHVGKNRAHERVGGKDWRRLQSSPHQWWFIGLICFMNKCFLSTFFFFKVWKTSNYHCNGCSIYNRALIKVTMSLTFAVLKTPEVWKTERRRRSAYADRTKWKTGALC